MPPSSPLPRNILIVGGGIGIGFEITKYLLNSTSCSVVVFGLHISKDRTSLQAASPTKLWLCTGNVTKTADCQEAVNISLYKIGGIDTMIYCARVMDPIQLISEVDMERVKRSYEVNIFGQLGWYAS
jgi:NAD(P)-dependent dehydrogenase (short-subunit alcohol dehydrogenase family)